MRGETIGRRQDGSRIDGVNSGDRIVARATLEAFFEVQEGRGWPSDPKLSIRMVGGFAEVVERKDFFGCGGWI